MGKTVCIYKLSPWKEEYVRDSDSIGFAELKHNHKFARFPPEHSGIPIEEITETSVQEVKIHTIRKREAYTPEIIENLKLKPEFIFLKQKDEVGYGTSEVIDDSYIEFENPTKIFQTTSYIGIFFDTGVPNFLRRTLNPEYIKSIERENEKLKMSESKLKQTKSILDRPIIGLLLYRLRQWWKKNNIKEKL